MDDLDFDNYWNQEGAFEDAVDDVQEAYEWRDVGDDTQDADMDEPML